MAERVVGSVMRFVVYVSFIISDVMTVFTLDETDTTTQGALSLSLLPSDFVLFAA